MNIKQEIDEMFKSAIKKKVSDIFFIPGQKKVQILFKLINRRQNFKDLEESVAGGVINFLKFQSGMDISEKRRPQLGSYQYQGVNLRLSSVGNYLNQEILVIRLIYPNIEEQELPEKLTELVDKKGLILFSGPMGSGKTSLMYRLAQLFLPSKTVMCIEDPTEIHVDGFLQLQVNDEAKMSYEELIKTSLRQRPDILIIGEIRDQMTAQLVVKAALSGYTVLSTIHAKSKYSVIKRMIEFGVDEFSLKSVLNAAVYQRLIPNINQKLLCVIDILLDFDLPEKINELKDWQNKLKKYYERGVINHQVYQKYFYG